MAEQRDESTSSKEAKARFDAALRGGLNSPQTPFEGRSYDHDEEQEKDDEDPDCSLNVSNESA